MKYDAILLGGGVGKRFSESSQPLPKQFQMLGQFPVFIHSIKALFKISAVRRMVLTMPPDRIEIACRQIQTYLPQTPYRIEMIPGGLRRQDSARLALEYLRGNPPDRVLIHDACRPYLSPGLRARVETALADESCPAWIPSVPVVETLKRVEGNRIAETVNRELFHRVQTPQIFDYAMMDELASKTLSEPALNFTDDASVCEYYGVPVGIFEGDARNVKLTFDFEMNALTLLLEESACESESATTFIV